LHFTPFPVDLVKYNYRIRRISTEILLLVVQLKDAPDAPHWLKVVFLCDPTNLEILQSVICDFTEAELLGDLLPGDVAYPGDQALMFDEVP